jgi:Protein of unknown function (DUF1676)
VQNVTKKFSSHFHTQK